MRYPLRLRSFLNIDTRSQGNKISQNKVQFETPNPLTHPDTPRPPNLIQVKTGKEIANVCESKTSGQTKLKHCLSHLAMTLQQVWAVKMRYHPLTWYHALSK